MNNGSNPSLTGKLFDRIRAAENSPVMTLQGAINKTLILLAILVVSAGVVWFKFTDLLPENTEVRQILWYAGGGAIIGFILALIITFKPNSAPVLAPFYALAQGVFIGITSLLLETVAPGIVSQAVLLTMLVFGTMLLSYRMGWLKATPKFKKMVIYGTVAIALLYLVNMIMGFFGSTIPYIHESGWIGIGFSIFVVGLAAFNLILDFDFIESASQSGAPKFIEWYAAFGLLLTLVWLYLEILRLLSKLRNN